MTSPAMDIAQLLEDDTIGTQGTDLFINFMPDTPYDCIVVYDTGGLEDNSRIAINYQTIMIKVRNKSQETAYSIIDDIRLALQSRGTETINLNEYFAFWISTPPTFIERDTNNNSVFSMNVRMQLTPNDKGNRL